jgi:drug/metabolite transporter (DMT)-like permease
VPLLLAYGAICLIWGSTYLAIKVGLTSFDPFFYAGVRYSLATLVMVPFARLRGASFAGPARRWLPVLGVGVLFIGICNGLVFWSETRLDSGFTALLVGTSPLWTELLTPLVPGERRLGRLGWAGIVVGFAGTALLVAPTAGYRADGVAVFAVLASVVVWVAASLWVRRLRSRFDPLAMTAVQMASGAASLLLVAGLRGRALVGPLVPRAVAALVYLVIFGSCVAFAAYFYLLHHWEASRVATSTYVNPVIAVILGAVLLGEVVTWRMVVGTAIILAGVTLTLREQHLSPGVARVSPGG